MTTIIYWILFACAVIIVLALAFALLFFIGAAFWGMWRGVKQLRGREVQVQDKTLPPPA